MKKLVFLSFALLCVTQSAQAEYKPQFWVKKAEIKKQSRWSLDEWLASKERMKSADLWLAFNSPSPYEFFLMGAANLTQPSNGSQNTTATFGLGAYAQAIGLEFDRETLVGPAVNGRFHFRIFGSNVQNTNLTLHVGLRQRMESQAFRQAYYGVSATLYLRAFFGVTGQWRNYFGSTPNPLGQVTGTRLQAGPFIDYGALRIFGNWVSETETGTVNSYSAKATGWIFGGTLFF